MFKSKDAMCLNYYDIFTCTTYKKKTCRVPILGLRSQESVAVSRMSMLCFRLHDLQIIFRFLAGISNIETTGQPLFEMTES